MRIVAIILGIILLLPGACGVVFLPMASDDPSIFVLVGPGLFLGGLGIWLIYKGATKKKDNNEPS